MPACSPQDLADKTGMHPSSLTQSLKRLQRKNVVFMAEDPKDLRRKILGVTRDGMNLIAQFESGIKNILQDCA
jgi:DNA-binding MarR family transcriptional regulator